MLVPINITGSSYRSRSKPLSAQTTKNWYTEIIDDPSAKSKFVLHSFPGLKPLGDAVGSMDRGMFEHLGIVYQVKDTTLYSINSSGVHTTLGTIAGTARCIMTGIGTNVVIANGSGVVYQWDGSTITTITDVDLESPVSVAHLNNQIIFDGDGGRFCTSDVGDATSISGLNYATAESNADDLRCVYVFGQYAYMMGDKTIEPWYNSVGSPPFDRVEGGIIPVGVLSIYSVANNDSAMYFLGDDNEIYRVVGTTQQKVSDVFISRTISAMPTVDDAIGWCFSLEGQNYYQITFPSGNKTFVFQESGIWFELSSGISGGRHNSNSYVYAFRKHLVADSENGKIYQMDIDTYTDNNEVIQRVRDTGPIHGGIFNNPSRGVVTTGKRLEMNRFELIMETGVGLVSGQGSDPVVMLQFSDDGGRTFTNEMWGKIGKLGQYLFKVEWFALGTFEERILRVTTSDPVPYSIHSGAADIEVCI